MCLASLIHMCHRCVLHDSFICVKTHSRVYHDAFICASWHIHSLMRGWGNRGYPRVISLLFAITANVMTHPYECEGKRMPQPLCVPWLIRMCAVTHSYVCLAHSYVCHDSVDQGLRMSHVTHTNESRHAYESGAEAIRDHQGLSFFFFFFFFFFSPAAYSARNYGFSFWGGWGGCLSRRMGKYGEWAVRVDMWNGYRCIHM